jgi:hypothetical protein
VQALVQTIMPNGRKLKLEQPESSARRQMIAVRFTWFSEVS